MPYLAGSLRFIRRFRDRRRHLHFRSSLRVSGKSTVVSSKDCPVSSSSFLARLQKIGEHSRADREKKEQEKRESCARSVYREFRDAGFVDSRRPNEKRLMASSFSYFAAEILSADLWRRARNYPVRERARSVCEVFLAKAPSTDRDRETLSNAEVVLDCGRSRPGPQTTLCVCVLLRLLMQI